MQGEEDDNCAEALNVTALSLSSPPNANYSSCCQMPYPKHRTVIVIDKYGYRELKLKVYCDAKEKERSRRHES